MKRNIYCLLFLLLTTIVNGQHVIDSLRNRIQSEKDDTNKVNDILNLSRSFLENGTFDSVLHYCQQGLAIAEKLKYNRGIANTCHGVAAAYASKFNYAQSDIYFSRSLKMNMQMGNEKGEMADYANMGITRLDQGDYPVALNLFLKAEAIAEKRNDKPAQARIATTIGIIYSNKKDSTNALKYYEKSLELYQELKDKRGIAVAFGNIGIVYMNEKNYAKAIDYYQKSLDMKKETGYQAGIVKDYDNLGAVYEDMGEYDKALEYFRNAYELSGQIGAKDDHERSCGNIGTIYYKQKKYKEAEGYLTRGLQEADSIHDLEDMKEVNQVLGELYSATAQWQKAAEAYKNYAVVKDSLNNKDKSKEIGKLEAKADFDKQLLIEQATEEKQAQMTAADHRKQQLIILFTIAIALAVACIAIIVMRSLRITRKQKGLIEKQKLVVEEQKAILEEKNKDITDSIHYASRIQRALLTTDDYIGRRLKEYFILFKPRDIVSGDFYWANEVETNEGRRFMICAGDCTGHGVPGAFMSLLNISMLNEANIEKKINEPAKILDEVREHIIKALNPEGKDEESKDGMDCTLCSFSLTDMILDFACANNPLWIIRNNECIEFKPDKMPVGMQNENHVPFTLQRTPIQKGDMIYIFTDGYADQFGGPKGKKFKYKQLQELLLANASKSMEEQKKMLESTMDEWKGNLEQVDDVLIIGIRV